MRKTECNLVWAIYQTRKKRPRIAVQPKLFHVKEPKPDLTEQFIDELYESIVELRREVTPSPEVIQLCQSQFEELRQLPMPNQYCVDTLSLIKQHLERLQ